MIHPLQLRYAPGREAAAAAWFLPGDSAAGWLEELSRCGLADMETRLFVIPKSLRDSSPAGLLVVPDRSPSLAQMPRGTACQLLGGRLFIPIDAELHPPVTDSELRTLFPLSTSFFHPVFGLSGFEAGSALRVTDLIELPRERSANWNFARPGAPRLPELMALALREPPSIDDVFGGAEDDIGSETPADLPPAPDEPGEGKLAEAQRKLRRLFAKGVASALRRLPHKGSRRTWVNDAEEWASRQLNRVGSQLDRLRNKELHRLLHLLDTDPEAGLRHALPLNQFGHRGTAPPGARLGSHSLDFNPGRIGGDPADFWNVPQDLQEILRRRYREMADREMQLGRHRRAAYIYAELLGDLVSAAHAFKRGRLFREAALLYEEHLKNPLEAARCLAEGGLLAEAIERYEKLGRWLDVADLHERMGDREKAESAIRRVVTEHLAINDILGAAKLVEERIHAPDEALEMLLNAWPASPQAATCLGGAFQLLARLGRNDVALDRLARLRREPLGDSIVMPLIATLGGAVMKYPHEEVRHGAADFSRQLIARQLQRKVVASDEAARLLDHLVRLAPQDRLLTRDANRYLTDRRGMELRSRQATPPAVAGNKPVAHRRIQLPQHTQWLQLRSEWHWFYALGVAAKRLSIVRGGWEGKYQSLAWDWPGNGAGQSFIFEPTLEQGSAIAVARADGLTLTQKRFPAADQYFNKECLVGTPSWLPTQGFPFAIGADSVWSVHLAAGQAVLSCHDKVRGQLLRTIDVTEALLKDAERTHETHLSLAALPAGVAVALGNRLVISRADGVLLRVELPGQVVRLFATLPNTRQGVAVMLEAGAVMFWLGDDSCMELERDIRSPLGVFIPGGPLVLASGSMLVLLEMDSRGVHKVVRMDLGASRVRGVSRTANPGEFAVLDDRGEIVVYRNQR